MSFIIIILVQRMPACKTDVKPYIMMMNDDEKTVVNLFRTRKSLIYKFIFSKPSSLVKHNLYRLEKCLYLVFYATKLGC